MCHIMFPTFLSSFNLFVCCSYDNRKDTILTWRRMSGRWNSYGMASGFGWHGSKLKSEMLRACRSFFPHRSNNDFFEVSLKTKNMFIFLSIWLFDILFDICFWHSNVKKMSNSQWKWSNSIVPFLYIVSESYRCVSLQHQEKSHIHLFRQSLMQESIV